MSGIAGLSALLPGLQCLEILKAAVQINTALKVGVMWDHNGTYMEGFGFQYRDQQVQINSHLRMTWQVSLLAAMKAAACSEPSKGNLCRRKCQ